MVRLAIIRDALSGEKELKNIDSRKTIKEIADKEFNSDVMETVEVYNQKTGETHYVAESVDNSSLKYFLNDKETDSLDYVLKDGDNLVIMASPLSDETMSHVGGAFVGGFLGAVLGGIAIAALALTGGWAVGVIIGAIATGGVIGGLIGLGDDKSSSSSSTSTSTGSKSVESIPDAAGSSNTSLIGNKYPLVLGKHLITPFIAGTPYNETLTSDTYGKYTYVHLLLCAGYAPLKLTEFKLGDLVLAHNKDNTVTIDGVSHTNSRDTVMHGVLTGYDETDYDSGDILNRWENNDVSLEILQKGDYSDSSRAYSDLYPQSCIQSEISATPLFVYDGAIESITTYKGSSFPSGYRTNTVRFSESCPTALEVEFNASNGLYRTRTETNDSNTSTVYNSLPIFIAVQWRLYKNSNSPSDANKGTGWNSFDSLNGVSPVSLTTEMMSTSTAAHEGNDLTSQTGDDAYSAYYNDWIGCSVFDLTQFSGTHDDSGSTDESSLSQMRFIARKSFTLDDCKKIAGITKDSDGNKYADLDSVEIRVVRIDSSYIDQTGSSDTSKYSSWSYNDLLKWTYLRTFQFDKTLLTSSSTLLSDCIKRPYSLPDSDKFCFIALKVKADLTGEITGQLDKFNCIAESFAPVLNTTTREWSISNVSKKYKYYDAGLTEITEAEYEAGIDNGTEVYKKTSGNDFKDQLDSLLWTSGNYNTSKSRWYLPSSYESLYISNNIASVFLTAMLGGDLGNEAYCYNDMNMQSVAAAFMYWNDVTDGSEYESGDDEYVSGGDNTIHMKWAFNGYITAATKQSTLIQNILTVGRGSLSIDESCRYKILIDKPRDYPVLTINQQNSMEETNTRSFEENISGYQIEFQNEDDNYESSTLYAMMDGEDYTNPTGEVESANFKYITSPRQAWSMGRYNLARLIVVREYLERTLGIAGVTLELGDVVNVQDDTILVGTDMGGRIQKLISDDSYIYGFITDELYEYTGEVDSDGKCKKGVEVIQPSKWGASRIVTIRMATTAGVIMASGETLAPVVGKTNQVVFESPIVRSTGKLYSGSSSDVHIYEPEVDNIVAFGEVGSITSQYIVARITPQENFKYKILLYPYDESVYNYGSAMPVIQNNMTKPNRSGDGDITVDTGVTQSMLNDKLASALDVSTSSPSIELSSESQIIAKSADGTVTPSSSFTVTATVKNTTITAWTYSVDGGTFSSTLPIGVTRTDNVVSINPATVTFKTLGINASDGTISDIVTIAKIVEGSDGYTVLLSNESYIFNGTGSTAMNERAVTKIYVYKGLELLTPTAVTTGALPTGMTASVGTLGTETAITFSTTTSMTSVNGTVPITITADGMIFVKNFIYQISLDTLEVYLDSAGCSIPVDDKGYTIPGVYTTDVHVVSNGNELPFVFGSFASYKGISITTDGKKITFTVAGGIKLGSYIITIPVKYNPVTENVFIGSSSDDKVIGYSNEILGYWNTDSSTYKLYKLSYSVFVSSAGGYLGIVTSNDNVILGTAYDVNLGDYFLYEVSAGLTRTYNGISVSFLIGNSYKWNGTYWELYKDMSASFSISTSETNFTRVRAGMVSPSAVTVVGKVSIKGTSSDFSGCFKYVDNNGNESISSGVSASFSIASGTEYFSIDLYISSDDTTAVASLYFNVPYNASVKPQYLGIGILSALSTKAYTTSTIAYNSTTDVATILAGSSYSDVITGDWIINYGTNITQGVYYWNGSTWTLTTDTKYTSDGTIQDIMKLNKLATPITLPDWASYVNLIAKNIFTTNLKILGSGKIFSGEGNYNNSDTPIFLGYDNSVAKFSLGDKLFFDGTNLNLTGIINANSGTISSIVIDSTGLYSLNYVSGLTGFKIGSDGRIDANKLYVGNLSLDFDNTLYNLTLASQVHGQTITGKRNLRIGFDSQAYLTTGNENISIGVGAGNDNVTGSGNIMIGASTTGNGTDLSHEINLGNRLQYMEFSASATQDFVYHFLDIYVKYYGDGKTHFKMSCIGCLNGWALCAVQNNNEGKIDFYTLNDTRTFSAYRGNTSTLGRPLRILIIRNANTPTNE